MQPATEKTENKVPPLGQPENNTTGNKPNEQEKKTDKQHPYLGILEQFDNDNLLNKVLNFIGHPLVLLGALIATVFLLTRGKQPVNTEPSANEELLYDIKKLKKQKKKLKAKLETLSGSNDKKGESELLLHKPPLQLPPPDSKPQTFYLD